MKKGKKMQLFLFFLVIFMGIALSSSNTPSKVRSSISSSYVGAANCSTCHTEEHTSWNATGHSTAAGQINATHYWVGNPYVIRSAADFASSCAKCHTTGYVYNETNPENSTWFDLGVQCERCHGADTMSLPVEQRINYSAALCGECHTQYGDWQLSAHNDSLTDLRASGHAADYCVRCHSVQSFVDHYNFSEHVEDVIGQITLNNSKLEPITCALCHNPHSAEHEYQLRFENSTELCGQCHSGSHHPQYELFIEGPHDKAGLECASCHGQGTRLFHGSEESWFNHTLWIYNTFYPYNQTDPIVCSSCHTQTWATSQLGAIQGLTGDLIANITQSITDAKAAITIANQTSGVNKTSIDEAHAMVEAAEDYVHYVESDGSEGFHNPEQSFAILGQAAHLASEAESTALNARAEALASDATSLGAQVTNLQNQVTSLQNQTATLQADIESLEAKIDDLESTASTVPYLYGGIGLAIGFIIGAAIIFAVRGRKP